MIVFTFREYTVSPLVALKQKSTCSVVNEDRFHLGFQGIVLILCEMYIIKYSDGVCTSLTPMAFLLPQLAYCVVQFLEKDPTLTEPVFFFFFFYPSYSKRRASGS